MDGCIDLIALLVAYIAGVYSREILGYIRKMIGK